MKKTILLVAFAFVALAIVQGQTKYSIVETKERQGDYKFEFVKQRMIGNERSVLPKLEELYTQEKQQTDTIMNQDAVVAFYQETKAALQKYYNSMTYQDTTWYYEYPSDHVMQGSGQFNGQTFGFDFYLNGDTTRFGVIQRYDAYQMKIDAVNNGIIAEISDESEALIIGYQAKMAEQAKLYQALMNQRE